MTTHLSSALTLALLLAPLGAGCNAVSGKIDDQGASISGGYFIQDDDLLGDNGVIQIFLSGNKDSCEHDAAYNDAIDDADDYADLESAWAENFPDDFWQVNLTVISDNVNADLSGEEWSGGDWDKWSIEDGDAGGGATHYTALLDEDYFSQAEPWHDYHDSFVTDGGTVTVKSHEPGESISGTFETTMRKYDDDLSDSSDAGDVTIRFQVERCDAVERDTF